MVRDLNWILSLIQLMLHVAMTTPYKQPDSYVRTIYQSRLYMDSWREEAELDNGRSGWTMSGKTRRRKISTWPGLARRPETERALSCKSLIVSTLMEERKEEDM